MIAHITDRTDHEFSHFIKRRIVVFPEIARFSGSRDGHQDKDQEDDDSRDFL